MLHGFVLSELRRILNAGVLRLEIAGLSDPFRRWLANFRSEAPHTVARRFKKCEWARVHSDESCALAQGRVETKIGVGILRRCAPQNDARLNLVVEELGRTGVGGSGVVWHGRDGHNRGGGKRGETGFHDDVTGGRHRLGIEVVPCSEILIQSVARFVERGLRGGAGRGVAG